MEALNHFDPTARMEYGPSGWSTAYLTRQAKMTFVISIFLSENAQKASAATDGAILDAAGKDIAGEMQSVLSMRTAIGSLMASRAR